mmetsp:Transcript_1879/g.4494  ORF Transcript_1879/g.4494 Transcript_1879/m.4494 type:complete len:262 (-) Transcript_1879:124-909(-)
MLLNKIHSSDDDDSTIGSLDGLPFDHEDDSVGADLDLGLGRNDKGWLENWVQSSAKDENFIGEFGEKQDSERAVEKWMTNHVYLPGSPKLERDEKMLISGWIAFSAGERLFRNMKSERKLTRKDIGYLTVSESSNKIILQQEESCSSGQGSAESGYRFVEFSTEGCYVEMKAVTLQHGRCVMLKDQKTGRTICTLMPVSLPRHFFCPNGDVVPKDVFDEAASDMFRMVDISYDHIAPTVQHEATLHILFAMDAWIQGRTDS